MDNLKSIGTVYEILGITGCVQESTWGCHWDACHP